VIIGKMKLIPCRIIFLLFMALLLTGEKLQGQIQTLDFQKSAENKIKIPSLAHHRFVPNPYVRDPFIKTHIRNTLGIGQAIDLNIPLIEIGGETILGLRGNLLFTTLNFEYQHAVKDWLAVWGNFLIVGRLGTGIQSILAQGITAGIQFELGWMFKFVKTERVMLSGTLNLWNSNGTVVDILGFVSDIVDSTSNAQLVRSRPFLRGGGGLRFAWDISELVGLTLLSETGYGESIDNRDKNKMFFELGGAIDFDLMARTSVPVGFALGYSVSSFPSGSDNTLDSPVQDGFLRIAYTGSSNFIISLDIIGSRIPLRQVDQTLNVSSVLINIRNYF